MTKRAVRLSEQGSEQRQRLERFRATGEAAEIADRSWTDISPSPRDTFLDTVRDAYTRLDLLQVFATAVNQFFGITRLRTGP
jgi:hypothetical protein